MIYNLGTKVQQKNEIRKKKRKKKHRAPVNNKTWYYMPDTIRRNEHNQSLKADQSTQQPAD